MDFGPNAATNVDVVSATQITATSPLGTGVVDVRVTGPGGTTTTSPADEFTYMQVTGVSPAAGPLAGGTPVTITGTGFTGATLVDFGTTPVSNFTVNSSGTQITLTSPAGTGTVDITVTGPGGTTIPSPADEFTFLAAPEVTGVSPAAGPTSGGTRVTITGTSFTDATHVEFGTNAGTSVEVLSATQIAATSPAGTGTVDVVVTGPGGVSTTRAGRRVYLYVGDGRQSGGGSDQWRHTGDDHRNGVHGRDGGRLRPECGKRRDGQRRGHTDPGHEPGGAGTVDVTVTGPGGTTTTSPADEFTYMSVTGVSPATGSLAGGTAVTITGTGFTGATQVDFGPALATNVVVVSATQITATSPAGTGTVDITVTGPGGTTTTSAADHFSYVAAPTVTGVSPITGPGNGGTAVTITGTGFTGATAVDFGTVAATNVVVVNSGEITATSPAVRARWT